MSHARLDTLTEAARNRGLKLIRSRVRTPGNRRFGKAGLTDARGEPVFGMDAKGPTATPEEIENYLRKLEAGDWGKSLGAPDLAKTKPKSRVAKPRPPKEKPKPQVREAKPADAPFLVELLKNLDAEIDEKQLRKNLALLKKTDDTPLVAVVGRNVVGLCGVGQRVAIHRPAPIGRITVLVVATGARGQGIGRMLVEAAEQRMQRRSCYLVEVTSNDRLGEAHAFYRHMGYERTSIRFAKAL